ncbi:hypothetical protein AAUPMB_08439 [Pasteurella multocida subsp. multocida str. Anand1_buffalo]|nr:hypothetical protein AAUPMB_08439 [Pasteurella multocida subsp. multocida str. Anand1_buffalo]
MEYAKNPLKKTTLALLCCSTAFSLSAKTDTNADKNHFLTEIVVYADQNKSMSSTQSVTQEDMKKALSQMVILLTIYVQIRMCVMRIAIKMDCNEVKLNPKTFQLMVQIISRHFFCR